MALTSKSSPRTNLCPSTCVVASWPSPRPTSAVQCQTLGRAHFYLPVEGGGWETKEGRGANPQAQALRRNTWASLVKAEAENVGKPGNLSQVFGHSHPLVPNRSKRPKRESWNEATARTSFYPGIWNGCDWRRMGVVEGECMRHRIHKSSYRILWNVMHGSMMLSLMKLRNPGWTPVWSYCAVTSCHSGTHPGSFPHCILPSVLGIDPCARAHTHKPLSQLA